MTLIPEPMPFEPGLAKVFCLIYEFLASQMGIGGAIILLMDTSQHCDEHRRCEYELIHDLSPELLEQVHSRRLKTKQAGPYLEPGFIGGTGTSACPAMLYYSAACY
jgi:hypothetical protein